MNTITRTATLAALAAIAGSAAASSLVFDRGLPGSNLNNAANANRSNVAWGFGQTTGQFASGDDFTLAATGDAANPLWRVDTVRMWIIAGNEGDSTFNLADRFLDTSLTVKNGADPYTVAASGNFIAGSSDTDNANIQISRVNYGSGDAYQTTSGPLAQIWQIDYTNLGLIVNPGDLVEFYGFGEAIDPTRAWFNHASNAALSGTTQDGADDLYRFLDLSALAGGTSDSNGNGWDKSSDINVQVFATAVPTPGAAAVLGLAGLTAARRRRA